MSITNVGNIHKVILYRKQKRGNHDAYRWKKNCELENLISSSSSQESLVEYNKCKSDLETLRLHYCRNNFAIKVRLV